MKKFITNNQIQTLVFNHNIYLWAFLFAIVLWLAPQWGSTHGLAAL